MATPNLFPTDDIHDPADEAAKWAALLADLDSPVPSPSGSAGGFHYTAPPPPSGGDVAPGGGLTYHAPPSGSAHQASLPHGTGDVAPGGGPTYHAPHSGSANTALKPSGDGDVASVVKSVNFAPPTVTADLALGAKPADVAQTRDTHHVAHSREINVAAYHIYEEEDPYIDRYRAVELMFRAEPRHVLQRTSHCKRARTRV